MQVDRDEMAALLTLQTIDLVVQSTEHWGLACERLRDMPV